MIITEEEKENLKLIDTEQSGEKKVLMVLNKNQKIVVTDRLKIANFLIDKLGFELFNSHLNPNNEKVVFVLIKKS